MGWGRGDSKVSFLEVGGMRNREMVGGGGGVGTERSWMIHGRLVFV